MKELKFEPEILQKHLAKNPRSILTGRDKPKGKEYELFRIEGFGVWQLMLIGRPCSILDYAKSYYRAEGFKTYRELYDILRRLYDNADIYPHVFALYLTEEQDKAYQSKLEAFT